VGLDVQPVVEREAVDDRPISPSTTWNNQPGWDGNFTATTPANHRDGGGRSCARNR
jgi:hypothetical protein